MSFIALARRLEKGRAINLFRPDLIGRHEELVKQLEGEIERVNERQFRPAHLLIGPAGVGKTRLLEELWEALAGNGSYCPFDCTSNHLRHPTVTSILCWS